MRLGLFFLIVLSLSCQTARERQEKQAKEKVQQTKEKLVKLEGAPKVDPADLKVGLTVEPYTKEKVKGALLVPSLDPRANYLFYSACSLSTEGRPCVEGSITGLTPESKFDFPEGRVKVTYKACVIPERSTTPGTNCSKEAWTYFNQSGGNPPEVLQLLLAEQRLSDQIQGKALEVRLALLDYKENAESFGLVEETEDFDTMVDNQLKMDPLVIGAYYDSEDMDEYMRTMSSAVGQEQEGLQLAENVPVVAIGATLVTLGSLSLAVTLWTAWAAKVGRKWGGLEGGVRTGWAQTKARAQRWVQVLPTESVATADMKADLKNKIGEFSSAWTKGVADVTGVKGMTKDIRGQKVGSGAVKGAIASAAVIVAGILIQVIGQLALAEDDPKRELMHKLDGIGADLLRLREEKKEVSQQI
ncbi:MAG: hypothetical protein HYW48_03895 [Deltaproteobacteria bacterium]|nr:hypothetical protein [Deltaproteobacteria bacterium]